jgi:small subunit ribosomal protein S6
MQSYEVMIAYHPDAGEAGIKELVDRARQVIAANGGEVTQVVEWGLRDLAYRIQKQRRGMFYVIEFKGSGATVSELERNLRISDRVLRYITVKVDPNRPPLEPPRARREASADAPEGGAADGEAGEDEIEAEGGLEPEANERS